MSKKEAELVQSGSLANVKFHSPSRLKEYIKLSRKLRDKYKDLTQRQNVRGKENQNSRTVEKARIFNTILNRYEKQYHESC